MNEVKKRVYKVLLVGNVSASLKNDIRRKYLGEGFKSDYAYTCGANFAVKKIESDESTIYIQTWQLADGPRWKDVRRVYYEGALGVIIIVNLDNIFSFESVPNIISEILSSNSSRYRHLMPVFMFIGISPSLGRQAKITLDQLTNYARALEYNLDTTAIIADCQLGCNNNLEEYLKQFAENIYYSVSKKNKDLSGMFPDFEIFVPSRDIKFIANEKDLIVNKNPLIKVIVEGIPPIKIRLKSTFESLGVKTLDPVECVIEEYEKYVRVYSNIFGLANFYSLDVKSPELSEILENPLKEIIFSYKGFDLFKGRFESLIPYFNELVLPIEEKEFSPNPLLKTYFRLRHNFNVFLEFMDKYNFKLQPEVIDLDDFMKYLGSKITLIHKVIEATWTFSFDEFIDLFINTKKSEELEYFFTNLLWSVIKYDYIEKLLIGLGVNYEFKDEQALIIEGKHANYEIDLNTGKAKVAATKKSLCIIPPKKKNAFIKDPLLTSLLGIKELKLPESQANLLSVIITLAFDDTYADDVILNQLNLVDPI